jgi:NAD(P)-dependent dehydrogenase (short-subunit alcohol dehydrogenase family)
LAGKVAIITGAGAGIGRAAALLFAAQGARVTVADIDAQGGRETVAAVRQGGGEAIFAECDVADSTAAQAMVAATTDAYGKLDVLVNNAGSSHGVFGPLHTLDESGFDRVIRTNIRGTFVASKYAIPAMLAAGGGAIVNIASAVGLVGWAGGAALCTAKGAVVLLTRAMALDYAAQNIRVNCICPGSTRTSQTEARLAGASDPEAVIAPLIQHHAIRRLARPEEIAAVALFLAADESSFMTGAAVPVDGGWTA